MTGGERVKVGAGGPGRPEIDRPNLNQLHRQAGSWTEWSLFYSGYAQHVGEDMQVILKGEWRVWADESLAYVRSEQARNGVTPDAVLRCRTVTADEWRDAPLTWVARDGSYGDGEPFVFDTTGWTEEHLTQLNEALDSDRFDVAKQIVSLYRR